MYAAEFLTVALIHLLAVASPGPDFAVVVRESVTHGRRAGTWTALGVGSAIFLHVGYSLLGIGLIVSQDRKSTRLNSSHGYISYAVFCLKKKKNNTINAL